MIQWLYNRVVLATVLVAGVAMLARGADEGVKLTQQEDRVRVEINGVHFTDYVFKGAPHVYYYPLIGLGGLRMTRDYPMKPDSEGEELSTECASAPMSGETLFKATARLSIPESCPLPTLRADLETIAGDLMADIRLQELPIP